MVKSLFLVALTGSLVALFPPMAWSQWPSVAEDSDFEVTLFTSSEDIDFEGDFPYAIDFGNEGDILIGDAYFTPGNAVGDDVATPGMNLFPVDLGPDFNNNVRIGSSDFKLNFGLFPRNIDFDGDGESGEGDEADLELIMRGLINSEDFTAGSPQSFTIELDVVENQAYKLQLFSGDFAGVPTRPHEIAVDGTEIGIINPPSLLIVEGSGDPDDDPPYRDDETEETADLRNSTMVLYSYEFVASDEVAEIEFVRSFYGIVTALTLEAIETPSTTCDFNGDGLCGINDLAKSDPMGMYNVGDLTIGVSAPPADAKFDLTGDGTINVTDLQQWLADAAAENGLSAPYLPGDVDLDGEVGFDDFVALSTAFGSDSADWSQGDFDGDMMVGFNDFVALSTNFGQSVASSVPEPASRLLCLLAVVGFLVRYRHA